jgi:hypothetical protein
MLRNYVRPSNHRLPMGRSARRQERSFAPGPSPALALRKTPHFAGPRPQSARPYQGNRWKGPSSLAPGFSSCRRVQHSCGSPSRQRPCAGASPSHHLRRLFSKVKFNLAAIPTHLCREESRQKCSGQQGSSRSGCWRRLCQSSFQGNKTFALAALPRCQPQTAPVAPHQRCCRCARIRRSVPVREDRCTPHQRHLALTPLGRPGPGAGGRLPSAQAGGLCRRLGA